MFATDMFYYIRDYNSNYYRVNGRGQLICAKGVEDATVFTFVDANKRITGGKKSQFYYMTPIDNQELVEDDISEKIDATEEVKDETSVGIDSTDDMEKGDTLMTMITSAVKELVQEEISVPVEKSVAAYDLSEIDWIEFLTHFSYVISGLGNYHDELLKQESEVDKKICDVLHYIELCDTDENEAVDLVELLRVCRENRREIKDELYRIEMFQKNIGTSANLAKAKEAIKCMKGLETRKYTPRKFTELFENCTMKTERMHSTTNNRVKLKVVAENSQEYYEESREEIVMERHETPFDGMNMDWRTFAEQQALFYSNVEQYIVNLQLDIEEIDSEIEGMLVKIEDTNANVAQAYKMFKALKNLRNERRNKAAELEYLYRMTDYIDCGVMADICESNLQAIEELAGVQEPDVKEEAAEEYPVADLAG